MLCLVIYCGNCGLTQRPDLLFVTVYSRSCCTSDVLIPGCNVPLSLWKSVIIALAAAIWDGLKLRAWEQCIIKVGHAEKSRAVPKDGCRLKTGAGLRIKSHQESTGYGSANCILTAGSLCYFVVLDRFMAIFILNCSCGAKNGGLFAELCMSVAQGRYPGGGLCKCCKFWDYSGKTEI